MESVGRIWDWALNKSLLRSTDTNRILSWVFCPLRIVFPYTMNPAICDVLVWTPKRPSRVFGGISGKWTPTLGTVETARMNGKCLACLPLTQGIRVRRTIEGSQTSRKNQSVLCNMIQRFSVFSKHIFHKHWKWSKSPCETLAVQYR